MASREQKRALTSVVYFNELTTDRGREWNWEIGKEREGRVEEDFNRSWKYGEDRKGREWTEGGSRVIRWEVFPLWLHRRRIRIELCVCVSVFSEALRLAFPPQAGAAKPVTMETAKVWMCVCVIALLCAGSFLRSLSPSHSSFCELMRVTHPSSTLSLSPSLSFLLDV